MYKGTSENMQRGASALTVNNLQKGNLELTPEDEYAALRKKIQLYELEIQTYPKPSKKRGKLAKKITAMQSRVWELKQMLGLKGTSTHAYKQDFHYLFYQEIAHYVSKPIMEICKKKALERLTTVPVDEGRVYEF